MPTKKQPKKPCQSCVRHEVTIRDWEEKYGALEERYRRLEAMSKQDPLTDLLNRRGFDEVLRQELVSAVRYSEPLCYAVCDIDHFKAVNDTHGHPVGDEVIKLVARSIKSGCRISDHVARLGGEEFGIILPRTQKKGAFILVDRIRKQIEKEFILPNSSGERVNCTVSFGVGQWESEQRVEDLLVAVDKALYRAKRGGRNRGASC